MNPTIYCSRVHFLYIIVLIVKRGDSMIVIVGPSASGKGKLLAELEKHGYDRVITYTSREPLACEVDGEDYHFLDKKRFVRDIYEGVFLEYNIIHGDYYGCRKGDLNDNSVVVLDCSGLRTIFENDLNPIVIFVDLPEKMRIIRMAERGYPLDIINSRIENDIVIYKDVLGRADIVFDNSKEITEERILHLCRSIDVCK
jgi:guanylate kinase